MGGMDHDTVQSGEQEWAVEIMGHVQPQFSIPIPLQLLLFPTI